MAFLSKKKPGNAALGDEGWFPEDRDDSTYSDDGHDESNWLVSYADLMTLLAGFFIMMFSLASMDKPKYEEVKKSVSEQFGGKYESPSETIEKSIEEELDKQEISDKVSVTSDAYGVSLSFESTFLFPSGSALISYQGGKLLTKIIRSIIELQKKDNELFRIAVEGHTDSIPIVSGLYPSNWELSGARAARVARLFIQFGFSPKALIPIAYADTRPLEAFRLPDGTVSESALAKNRRVVIRVFTHQADSMLLLDAKLLAGIDQKSDETGQGPQAIDPKLPVERKQETTTNK